MAGLLSGTKLGGKTSFNVDDATGCSKNVKRNCCGFDRSMRAVKSGSLEKPLSV
jgi:hypothetical protein